MGRLLLDEMVPDLAEVYRGHDGVEPADQRQRGRTAGSGPSCLPPYAQVFTVRDGKLVR